MKFKSFKTSIRTRSLFYFLILITATVALLWLMQEWFLSTQFDNLNRGETVRTLERYTANFDYENDDYNALLSSLSAIASQNGMVIYCFAFNGDIVQAQEKDSQNRPLKYFDGEFDMCRVVTPYSQDFFMDIESEANLQSNIIYLTSADTAAGSATNYIINDSSNKINYASFKSYSDGTSFFFYMEAVISAGDIEGGVYRLLFLAITFIAATFAVLLSILFSRLVSKPIGRLGIQAGIVAGGDYNARFAKSSITEINELAKSLNLVAEEFSKTEQLRRDFLANITHDLRTPLTLIRGYAELIHDQAEKDTKTEEAVVALKQKQGKNAQIIVDESIRLANLVEDVQKLSKLQSGTDAVNLTVFDLDGFLKPLTGQFGIVNIKYGCPVEYVNDAQKKTPVSADSEKITLVMYNLITNAINYADKVSPKVAIRLSTVVEKKQRQTGKKQIETIETHYALVEVTDNGKGIPKDEIDSVWDRYYRSSQKKRNTVGTGLGLSIVKSILTAHNAPYGIESELDKGTTFWFKLKIVGVE